MRPLLAGAALAAMALAGCGHQAAPEVTVTRTVTVTASASASASPSASQGVNLAADASQTIADGTGSTLCTDAADGALTTSQQESYIYETADTPGLFHDGDLLTPRQARQVMIAVMKQLCPQLTGEFTFSP